LEELELKSKDKVKRAEGFAIIFILFGGIILSVGIGLSILNPKGVSAILAMLGSFLVFVSTLGLVLIWLIKEFRSD